MAEIVGIGGVVLLQERRYVVVGHRIAPDGDVMGLGYLVVPYPLGFIDAKSLLLVPASSVEAIVRKSYADEQGDAYLTQFGQLVDAVAGIPASEYEESVRLLADFARKEADNA